MPSPLQLIDTHAHLYLPEFDSDRELVIQSALNRGVFKILLPNINRASMTNLIALTTQYPKVCYPVIGLHPTSVGPNYLEDLTWLEQELIKQPCVGIGETGIDLYWDRTYLNEQRLAFIRHVELSAHYKLPLIIHARESFNEILDILAAYKENKVCGIFHAFSGTPEIARKVIDLGFKLGIGGMVTYKNTSLPEVLRMAGLTDIVLETDSPYLTPHPFRGKRNESGYIQHIADAVKQIKKVTLEEVAAVTTGNVLSMFSLDTHD